MYSNAITNDKKDGVKILSDEYIAFSLSREVKNSLKWTKKNFEKCYMSFFGFF
jgi:hypothetical protein